MNQRPSGIYLEIDEAMACACIDGMTRVSQVGRFVEIFPAGAVYRGGICLHFEDYPLDVIRQLLSAHGYNLTEYYEAPNDHASTSDRPQPLDATPLSQGGQSPT